MSAVEAAERKRVREPASAEHAPVIFLDIDGVLNRTRAATHVRLDEDLMERFVNLVASSGAVVVLSTFWRPFLTYVQYIFTRYGIPATSVVGRTPGISSASSFANGSGGEQLFSSSAFDDNQYVSRAAEIHAWLDAHPSTTHYVILDDRPSAADERLRPRFVQTDSATGLSEADVTRCLQILSPPAPLCTPCERAPVYYLHFPQWQGSSEPRHVAGSHAAAAVVERRLAPQAKLHVEVAREDEGSALEASSSVERPAGGVKHLDSITVQARRASALLDSVRTQRGGDGSVRWFTCGGDCGVEVVPVSHANRSHPGLALVWLDAHADLNSPASSPSSKFHGMPVRTLLGDGPPGVQQLLPSQLEPSQIVYVGVRDLDPEERAYIDRHRIPLISPQSPRALDALVGEALAGFTAAYVHVDLDVLDPSVFPCTCCPTAAGLSLEALVGAIAAIKRAVPEVVGCGLTECCGDPSTHLSQLEAVVDALVSAIEG